MTKKYKKQLCVILALLINCVSFCQPTIYGMQQTFANETEAKAEAEESNLVQPTIDLRPTTYDQGAAAAAAATTSTMPPALVRLTANLEFNAPSQLTQAVLPYVAAAGATVSQPLAWTLPQRKKRTAIEFDALPGNAQKRQRVTGVTPTETQAENQEETGI